MEDNLFGIDIVSKSFGYILWYLFDLTRNYGVAVCLFALLVSILTFPLIVKRNRGVVSNERFEAKKEDLRKKCGNDRKRFNKECIELAEKEQINPMSGSGTLTMLVTMIMFFLIYSTVQKPLTNVLHLPNDKVSQATGVLTEEQKKQKGSDQLDLIRSFPDLKDKLTMFSDDELKKISKFSKGFNFVGINLLSIPKFSSFNEFLWVLPIMSFFVSALGTYIMQKTSGISSDIGAGKYLVYIMSIFQAWIVSRVFAVLGIYLLINNILGTIQALIIERFFSSHMVKAKKEKKRINELLRK